MSAIVGLRDEILGRALGRRPPGRPVDPPDLATPLEAFRSATSQLSAVLDSLTAEEWTAPAHPDYGAVRDVIAHLVGVERLAVAWVEAPLEAKLTPTEHRAATCPAIDELATTGPTVLTRLWLEGAQRLRAACAEADPAKRVLAFTLPTDVEGLLVLRAFELWAHLQDVCRAVGRPVPAVDDGRMALMSSRLMGAVAQALALSGTTVTSQRVRFVLTGRAGGCFDVHFDPVEVGRPAHLTLVAVAAAAAVDVCRLAARRGEVEDLEVHLEGDHDLAGVVLHVLDAFAQD